MEQEEFDFYQELLEQNNSEENVIDWDDYSQGSIDAESYDP